MTQTDRIKALRTGAAAAGDMEMVDICNRALRGNQSAIAECERVMEDVMAMNTEEDSEMAKTQSVKVRCLECGKLFSTRKIVPECPQCGGVDIDVREGA